MPSASRPCEGAGSGRRPPAEPRNPPRAEGLGAGTACWEHHRPARRRPPNHRRPRVLTLRPRGLLPCPACRRGRPPHTALKRDQSPSCGDAVAWEGGSEDRARVRGAAGQPESTQLFAVSRPPTSGPPVRADVLESRSDLLAGVGERGGFREPLSPEESEHDAALPSRSGSRSPSSPRRPRAAE